MLIGSVFYPVESQAHSTQQADSRGPLPSTSLSSVSPPFTHFFLVTWTSMLVSMSAGQLQSSSPQNGLSHWSWLWTLASGRSDPQLYNLCGL